MVGAAPSTKLRRVDPKQEARLARSERPDALHGGCGLTPSLTRMEGELILSRLTGQPYCSIKKKPGSNRASRNPLTQHNSDILPDGSLDYPDDVLARLACPKLIRTKVMPTAPRAPAVIAPQWTPDA